MPVNHDQYRTKTAKDSRGEADAKYNNCYLLKAIQNSVGKFPAQRSIPVCECQKISTPQQITRFLLIITKLMKFQLENAMFILFKKKCNQVGLAMVFDPHETPGNIA
ncbi:hypothetical protein CIPAW_08G083300 [Carya illinoinensis]|uniref:Uncharacterized protein n=1 Tax=Carya illinoinensis TaxID=32201 RepID=A0A8T1PPG6_CARIL|nr:hypothetical protein CIPAW_08G083300 [Carya illinoinensis]